MDRTVAFGIRLKALRSARGFSQERLAEIACLHRTYIGGVERGERNISLVNIWRIADALEIDPSLLFAGSHETRSSDIARGRSGVSAKKRVPQEEHTWTKRRKRQR